MQQMTNSAIVFAALLMATPTLAAAETSEINRGVQNAEISQRLPLEQCLKIEIPKDQAYPTYVKYADTTHCFLRIDGKIIINRMCHVDISQQVRSWQMEVAEVWVADVWMKYYYHDDVSDKLRRSFYASFKKRDRSLNYGRVEAADDNRQEHICFVNKRFRMCFSQPYLICDPEKVKAQQAN
jgi:hypothetical protein